MAPTSYSALSPLECPSCGTTCDAVQVPGPCACGAPRLARYDPERVVAKGSRAETATRPPALWRYHELLPVSAAANVVSLGEGMTPLLRMSRTGAALGVPGLMMKDEGLIPTGTFKARGAAVGVSRAAELGVAGGAMPPNGDAGAAWAAPAARAGLARLIPAPTRAPAIPPAEVAGPRGAG